MVTVTVPATSANVGAGFDSLGLAVSMHNVFTFEESDRIQISSVDGTHVPAGSNNLVYRSARVVYDQLGIPLKGLRITQRNDIPMARGLGSSSACIVAGIMGANALLGDKLTERQMLTLATAIEGHPDNAAPAFLGGLTASFMHEGRAVAVPFSPDPAWRFVAVIPNYEVRTEEARRIVRRDIDLSAAVHTMSHAIAMVRGLETGDEALVGAACADVLHEPYRRTLIAEYDAMRAMALEAGAATFFISGSGSTMIAATKSEAVAEAFVAKVRETWPDFAARVLTVCHEGTTVTVED